MAQRTSLNAEIAALIRTAATERNVTHRDLALAVGIPDRTFARLLVGTSDWKIADVNRIAGELNVDLITLLPSVTR